MRVFDRDCSGSDSELFLHVGRTRQGTPAQTTHANIPARTHTAGAQPRPRVQVHGAKAARGGVRK